MKNKTKITEFQENNDNENTKYQNLWNTLKAMSQGKSIALKTYK